MLNLLSEKEGKKREYHGKGGKGRKKRKGKRYIIRKMGGGGLHLGEGSLILSVKGRLPLIG